MKIGNYEVQLIKAGRFRLDGGAMFGVVPRVLWEKKFPPDEKNRILMNTNLLLIRNTERLILVDTGLGEKYDEKFRSIYAIDLSEMNLEKGLQEAGVKKETITDVIITHLHFDHAGGTTTRVKDGSIQPTFPNATYYVQAAQYEWAMQPSEKDRASYFRENYEPLREMGRLQLLNGDSELFPGIHLLVTEGHTPGQQLVKVEGEDGHLLFAADLIPTAAHVPLPWVMAYDLHPLQTIAEKKKLLPQAVEENWIIVFEHDPYLPASRIEKTDKGFQAGEPVEL